MNAAPAIASPLVRPRAELSASNPFLLKVQAATAALSAPGLKPAQQLALLEQRLHSLAALC